MRKIHSDYEASSALAMYPFELVDMVKDTARVSNTESRFFLTVLAS